MYGEAWTNAAISQAIVMIGTALVGRGLGLPWRAIFVVLVLGNAVPIAIPPGFATPVFLQDILVVVLGGVLVISRNAWRWNLLVVMGALAFCIWPVTTTVLSVLADGRADYGWITFAFRRLVFALVILFAVEQHRRGMRASEFMDAWVLFWSGLCSAGVLHYLGVMNLYLAEADAAVIGSIVETRRAQTGIFALWRGQVGLLGSITWVYCFTMIVFGQGRSVWKCLYCWAAAMSMLVIIFSGSRSGLVAASVVTALLTLKALLTMKPGRHLSILLVALIAGSLGLTVSRWVGDTVANRYDRDFAVESYEVRHSTQAATIRTVSASLRGIVLGWGGGAVGEFGGVGDYQLAHAHNDFLRFLFEGGALGVLLYVGFLYVLFSGMVVRREGGGCVVGLAGRAMLGAGTVVSMMGAHLGSHTTQSLMPGVVLLFAYALIRTEVSTVPSGCKT